MTGAEDLALARALDDHAQRTSLPAGATVARRLLARLTDPVQIVVAGAAGTGRTTLCDLLARAPGLVLRKVRTDGAAGDLRGADIVILCGTAFGREERHLWDTLTHVQRDHCLFVLTMADRLAIAGRLQDALAALDEVAGDLMQTIVPLATPQALAARDRGDVAGLRTSGGAALLQAVDRLVAAGRDAARDAARLFLTRHADVIRHPVAPMNTPINSSAGWQAARAQIENAADDWSDLATIPARDRPRAILDRACKLAQNLCDLAPPGQGALCDELAGVADMVQLMRAEGGAVAATDALVLLTQFHCSLADIDGNDRGATT